MKKLLIAALIYSSLFTGIVDAVSVYYYHVRPGNMGHSKIDLSKYEDKLGQIKNVTLKKLREFIFEAHTNYPYNPDTPDKLLFFYADKPLLFRDEDLTIAQLQAQHPDVGDAPIIVVIGPEVLNSEMPPSSDTDNYLEHLRQSIILHRRYKLLHQTLPGTRAYMSDMHALRNTMVGMHAEIESNPELKAAYNRAISEKYRNHLSSVLSGPIPATPQSRPTFKTTTTETDLPPENVTPPQRKRLPKKTEKDVPEPRLDPPLRQLPKRQDTDTGNNGNGGNGGQNNDGYFTPRNIAVAVVIAAATTYVLRRFYRKLQINSAITKIRALQRKRDQGTISYKEYQQQVDLILLEYSGSDRQQILASM